MQTLASIAGTLSGKYAVRTAFESGFEFFQYVPRIGGDRASGRSSKRPGRTCRDHRDGPSFRPFFSLSVQGNGLGLADCSGGALGRTTQSIDSTDSTY